MVISEPSVYVKVGFYLPRVLVERLRMIARHDGTPASRIVSRLILGYIETYAPAPTAQEPNGDWAEGSSGFDFDRSRDWDASACFQGAHRDPVDN